MNGWLIIVIGWIINEVMLRCFNVIESYVNVCWLSVMWMYVKYMDIYCELQVWLCELLYMFADDWWDE